MRFNHWNIGHREGGDVVVVNLSGNAANVRLLDSSNFQSYKAGRRHSYYGGLINRSPAEIPIPRSGTWHVVADMQGLRGQPRIGVQVVPRAARQPLPRYQQPSLAPIAQAVAEIPPAAFPPDHPAPPQAYDALGGIDNFNESTPPPTKAYDVFISHATEDKEEVVRPLALALREQGLSVWYDEFALRIGDSLRRKIDAGIAQSRFGVVILSEQFFAKQWPQYELDGIVTMRLTGAQTILPIWHKITKSEVIAQSPVLADTIARSTTDCTIEEIAAEIAEVIHDQKPRVATDEGQIRNAVLTG